MVRNCDRESCGFINDAGVAYCARCGSFLGPAQPLRLSLEGSRRLSAAAENGVVRLRWPGEAQPNARIMHWGRSGGRTHLFVDDPTNRAYEVEGGFGTGFSLKPTAGPWPSVADWICPPIYAPLAVATASPERLVWKRVRRNIPPGPVQEARVANQGDRLVGLGLVGENWLVTARRRRSGELTFEAGSGESTHFLPIATVRGPVPADAAVFVGSASWLDGVAPSVRAEGTDEGFVLSGQAAAARIGLRRIWAIVANRFLVLDLASDQVVVDVKIGARGLPLMYWTRQEAGIIEPVVLSGRSAGLYVSYYEEQTLRHGFVAAANLNRITPLKPPPTRDLSSDRKACLVAARDAQSALFVNPEFLALYVGPETTETAESAESKENPFRTAFEPLAGPGFFACFAEPRLSAGAEAERSQLQIFRQEDETLRSHARLSLDMPIVKALPPLLADDQLQLLGQSDDGLLAISLPVGTWG